MRRSLFRLSLFLLVFTTLPSIQADERPALDHSVYTEWNRIQEQGIGPEGEWAFWSMSPEESDGMLVVQAIGSDSRHEIPRGDTVEFDHTGRYLIHLVHPPRQALRDAKLDEDRDEASYPKPALGVLDLASGAYHQQERVRDYRTPEESGGIVAWRHATPVEEETENDHGTSESGDNEEKTEGRDDELEPGTELVLLDLADGGEHRFTHVSEYTFSRDGSLLAFARVTPDGAGDGVYLVDTDSGRVTTLVQSRGEFRGLSFDKAGGQLAFVGRPTPPEAEDGEAPPDHAYSLYYWRSGQADARVLADETASFLAEDWHVSRHRDPAFSDSGDRLFFGTAPEPVKMPENEDRLEDEIVEVDIWHWQDDLLQPQQLEQREEERERSYLAVAHLDGEAPRLVQLGQPEIPEVDRTDDGDARYFLGVSGLPYHRERSWDYPWYYDAWRINVATGEAERILEAVQDRPALSPSGRYVSWWDRDQASWFATRMADRTVRDLGENIDVRLDDHRNDRPFDNGPYEDEVWLAGDAGVLVHGRFDLWRVDPATGAATSLSRGHGREQGWRYRIVDLDPEEPGIEVRETLLATTFDEADKDHGFARLSPSGDGEPEQLVMSAHHYSTPEKAERSGRLLFTRENFQSFPDLHVAGMDFGTIRRLSEANPQQSDYRWGQVELVEWEGETGRPHQGMLFRPEDFDPDRAYPMIVYFYERSSDGFNEHRPPQAHRSVIIPTFYTSNDYIVFVPDVWYREGAPGESAMESIMPMTRQLAAEPWVDENRVGLQGHSWAGYQIAYMVTQTDFFRAAAGGAPVSNMTSAYGGIRWRSGMSRMFQYEDTQSRLGATLWEDPDRYIANSPIFMADQINTPLMMLHNDHDGAVPWEQGIELFTALRRLNRPAWLINYNNEPHWPQRFANREDWQIRLEQFFDHFLKDEPAPRWLSSGIPALEKGATLGREPE